jgi:hypothetical protein
MPRLRCPRCATVVDVAAGAAPSCPSCGFGSAAAPAAPAAPAAVPDARFAPPAPAARGNGGRVVAIVAVALVVLAGAAVATAFLLRGGSDPSPLTEEQARSRVAASLLAADGLFSGEAADGDLVRMDGRATPAAGGASGEPFGDFGNMHMVAEWGRDGASQLRLDAANGPVTVAFTMTCAEGRRAMEYGGEAFVSRPYVDGAPDCLELFGGEEEDGEGFGEEAFPTLEELRAEDAAITVLGDGGVRAEFDEDGARVVMLLDARGRLRSLEAEAPGEGTWTVAMEYGSRRSLSLPEDASLMPAEVESMESHGEETGEEYGSVDAGGPRVWEVLSSPQEPPLSEMEVRIQPYGFGFDGFGEGDGEEAPGETLSFPAHVKGPQVQGNYTVQYHDADGDGKVSEGDTWELTDAAQVAASEDPWSFDFADYEVVLYDKVADGAVNTDPLGMPGPGWLALAGLALGAALLRRR